MLGWAGLGRAGHNKTRQEQETFDDELAQDCKHKEIIKGGNEEGNEGRQVGQIGIIVDDDLLALTLLN